MRVFLILKKKLEEEELHRQQKKQEEELHQQKKDNSNDDGEKNVEYVLKWFIASTQQNIVSIKGDCESKYRLNCILLNKPDFLDDPQEYDHILVCSAGIILIETKHWKGVLEIRDDGKWIRQNESNVASGEKNPKLQLRRHELMLQKIIPNVKIYSLLCFSNEHLIINGKENFKDFPIITIEQLEDKLLEISSVNLYNDEEINRIVETINNHKINTMQGDI